DFWRTVCVDALHRVLLSAPRRSGTDGTTALTATARQFPLDAGKALGAIALGLSLAQAVFPVIALQISALTGWRVAWGINAGMLVAGVGVALMFLPSGKDKPLRTFRKRG
ncbi:MFS transporter, partial [Escherichia coli]|uniref:MFS transporter n=1 Tax=Escherichia coli TaxID=562 RepID=UPI0035CD1AB1